jgi:MFS family permease
MILATNLLVIASAGLTLIDNSLMILIGRFFFGLAIGTFSLICPKFVNELVPLEYKGSLGTIS